MQKHVVHQINTFSATLFPCHCVDVVRSCWSRPTAASGALLAAGSSRKASISARLWDDSCFLVGNAAIQPLFYVNFFFFASTKQANEEADFRRDSSLVSISRAKDESGRITHTFLNGTGVQQVHDAASRRRLTSGRQRCRSLIVQVSFTGDNRST